MNGPMGTWRRKRRRFRRWARRRVQRIRSASVISDRNDFARNRFMPVIERCAGAAPPSRFAARTDLPLKGGGDSRYFVMSAASRAQSSRERRYVERLEAVMGKPAHVALEHLPQIVHAVFQHRDAIDAHAPCKTLVDVGIDAAGAQHIGMHHAAAENLEPILALAEADFALVTPALDVGLERRFGERKERRAKAHVDVIDLEERLAEFVQD